MSAHVSDELPRLLTGDASREEVLEAATHLRTCVDCQHELVSAVIAHASLTSAQRFAPEIVARPAPGTTYTHPTAPETPGTAPGSTPQPLPDLADVFAQVRREAAEEQPPERIASGRRLLLPAVAAAAVVVAGGAVWLANSGNDNASAPNGRTVALAAYDTGRSTARATIGGGRINLDATSLPPLTGKRYEVWLTNDQRTRMQPIGWIGNNGKATLDVPADLMTQFADIEVSVQNVSAHDYTFSGTSVLRGSMR
jgi:hypothetical protein